MPRYFKSDKPESSGGAWVGCDCFSIDKTIKGNEAEIRLPVGAIIYLIMSILERGKIYEK